MWSTAAEPFLGLLPSYDVATLFPKAQPLMCLARNWPQRKKKELSFWGVT